MKIKALAIYKPNLKSGKVNYEVKALENPMLPPFTKAHVVINEEVMVSVTHPKTMQVIDVEVTFECLKCDFKTASLEEMDNHSEKHVMHA